MREKSKVPHRFFHCSHPDIGEYLLIPSTSSKERKYVPIGFEGIDTVSSNANSIVKGATLYHFGIVTSSMHMAWMRVVAGRLKSDYRYSGSTVYNTFPWPEANQKIKDQIAITAKKILLARKKYPDISLDEMYGKNMYLYSDLVDAHEENDKAVLKAYGLNDSVSEADIVVHLLELYAKKVSEIKKHNSIETAIVKVIGKNTSSIPDWLEELRTQCLTGLISTDELIAQGKAKKKEIATAERKAKKEAEKAARNSN